MEQIEAFTSLTIKLNSTFYLEVIVKIVGYVISIGGFFALIYTGINYINQSESFSLMGVDFAVSKGDPTPVIISVIVMIAGLLITRASKNNGS